MSEVVLETARLRLRPFTADDVGRLHRHWIAPDVRRWLWDGREVSRDEVVAIVDESRAAFAAGGVGLVLCHIGKMRGALVIGTVSTEEKAKLAREAGASDVILYMRQDFEAEVKRLTDGKGVQVVYDSVGQTTFDKGFNCLAPRGMMALFGQSSGPIGPFDPQTLNAKGSLFLTRPSLNHHIITRAELLQRSGELLGWIRDGKLKLRTEFEFPLKDASEAHRALEGRKTTGKVLLIP